MTISIQTKLNGDHICQAKFQLTEDQQQMGFICGYILDAYFWFLTESYSFNNTRHMQHIDLLTKGLGLQPVKII